MGNDSSVNLLRETRNSLKSEEHSLRRSRFSTLRQRRYIKENLTNNSEEVLYLYANTGKEVKTSDPGWDARKHKRARARDTNVCERARDAGLTKQAAGSAKYSQVKLTRASGGCLGTGSRRRT